MKKDKTIRHAKQKRIIRRLVVITGILIAIVANVIFFGVINKHPFNYSQAFEVISLKQQILPLNPVGEVSAVTAQKKLKIYESKSPNFRIAGNLESSGAKDVIVENNLPKVPSVTTFKGKTLFPDSDVYLEVHSTEFFVHVKSDSNGGWTWNNSGKPLEDGTHTMAAYNISPYEFSAKTDVYSEKFRFQVDSSSQNNAEMTEFKSNMGYAEKTGDGNLGDFFLKNNASRLYFFDIAIAGKKEYFSGDEINLGIIFSDFGAKGRQDAKVYFEIYEYGENGLNGEPVSEFSDDIPTSEYGSFLKKIKLKDRLKDGSYVIVVKVKADGKEYVQSSSFTVSDVEVVRMGGLSIKREAFLQITVWNIIGLLGVLIILMYVTIYEYKRMLIYDPLNEADLKRKKFF